MNNRKNCLVIGNDREINLYLNMISRNPFVRYNVHPEYSELIIKRKDTYHTFYIKDSDDINDFEKYDCIIIVFDISSEISSQNALNILSEVLKQKSFYKIFMCYTNSDRIIEEDDNINEDEDEDEIIEKIESEDINHCMFGIKNNFEILKPFNQFASFGLAAKKLKV